MRVASVMELMKKVPTLRFASGQSAGQSVDFQHITEDSRDIDPAGTLFFARQGERFDAHQAIPAAIESGAVAVLVRSGITLPNDARLALQQAHVVHLEADDLALAIAMVAEAFYDFPSHKLQLIGITGTNGKTTTAHLIHQLLNQKTNGDAKCGLIGTVCIDVGDGPTPAELTTPFAITLSRLLAAMVANGCTHAVMETSSHALEQQRTAGLTFAGGIFTNLSGDHLDYHPTMDAYASAKSILFEYLDADGWCVLNGDDPATARIFESCNAIPHHTFVQDHLADKHKTVNSSSAEMDWSVRILEATRAGMSLEITPPTSIGQPTCVRTTLVGEHNAMNLLQACAAVVASGCPFESCRRQIPACIAPPGRLERVFVADPLADDISVLVDYAHTDDALRNVLQAARQVVPEGARLIVVFGCGGDRDTTKRPRMASAACDVADIVVVTSDNPRTENANSIVNDILKGVSNERVHASPQTLWSEVDRGQAILMTITEIAQANDVIVIAGKGHEDYQIVGTIKHPFDDRVEARQALQRRYDQVVN